MALGVAGDPADRHPLVGQEGRCGLLHARHGASLLLPLLLPGRHRRCSAHGLLSDSYFSTLSG
jgi:hypothetical protein